jgi:hypothetical protein
MLMRQPFFIGGIEDVEKAKGSAFGAAGTFFFTFMVSMLYIIKDARRMTVGSRNNNGARLDNPFYATGISTTSLFHDYDPVDSTIASTGEIDSPGVFT